MKINYILLTISCFIIINADIVYPQINSNLSQSDKRKIAELMKGDKIIPQSDKSETSKLAMDFTDSLFIYTPDAAISKPKLDELQYFGYDFFTTLLDRKIWDNIPPHSGYVLGVGDEVIIEIWGETQLRISHVIDQYGKIYVDKIGQVHLAGGTLKDVENKLLKKFRNVHSSLKGDQPTSILDVSIGKLKSINVTLVGEANRRGIVAIHPFSTIINGLLQMGGLQITGSLRNIQLIRNGQTFATLDFYQYLLNGNTGNDLRLLDGDIIFIPIRHSTVSIEGQILRGGIYELFADETLKDLVQFAGGFEVSAQNDIRIDRQFKMKDYMQNNRYNETVFIDYINNADYILADGDAIMVYEEVPSKNEVFVYGQVKKPGKYSFNSVNQMFLLDVLTLAGGFNDSTYLKTIYLDEGEIIRSQSDNNYPEVKKFDIHSLLNGDPDQNIILQNWDIVLIRQNPNFRSPKKVSIMGEVKVPGIYTLQKKWETLEGILQRSGGFTNQAFKDGFQMYRNNQQIALQDFNIVLLDGDSLHVPEHPGVVQLLGAVNRPGLVQYIKKKSLNDYLDNAGGFTLEADKNNISIVFANGDVKIKKRFLNPRIGEGATIIVQYKKSEEPFNFTEYASNLASIVTSLATLYLLTK